MDLSEFILQPRGPYLFDHYQHPVRVESPLGAFTMEFHVDDAEMCPPNQRMLAAMTALRAAFIKDCESLVDLVHQQYELATEDAEEDPEWFEDMEIPIGLSRTELAPLLSVRTITVSQFDTDSGNQFHGCIYMQPEWDAEHGLSFKRERNKWVRDEF